MGFVKRGIVNNTAAGLMSTAASASTTAAGLTAGVKGKPTAVASTSSATTHTSSNSSSAATTTAAAAAKSTTSSDSGRGTSSFGLSKGFLMGGSKKTQALPKSPQQQFDDAVASDKSIKFKDLFTIMSKFDPILSQDYLLAFMKCSKELEVNKQLLATEVRGVIIHIHHSSCTVYYASIVLRIALYYASIVLHNRHSTNIAHTDASHTQQMRRRGGLVELYYTILVNLDEPQQQLQLLQFAPIFAGQLQGPKPLYSLLVSASNRTAKVAANVLDAVLQLVATAVADNSEVASKFTDAVCSWVQCILMS
jgi:hypothetical protein